MKICDKSNFQKQKYCFITLIPEWFEQSGKTRTDLVENLKSVINPSSPSTHIVFTTQSKNVKDRNQFESHEIFILYNMKIKEIYSNVYLDRILKHEIKTYTTPENKKTMSA